MSTKSKSSAAKSAPQQKPKDPRFRVVPNLSLRGTDIMKRLKNGSLKVDVKTGQYSIDDEIDASRRMTKADIINASRKNFQNINNLNNKLNASGNNRPSSGGNKEG